MYIVFVLFDKFSTFFISFAFLIFSILFVYLIFFRPERTDFVRMAGLLDAIIVPFSAVGISDSVTILLDQTGAQQIIWKRRKTD